MLADRNDKVLREQAREVRPEEIGSAALKKLIKEMQETLHAEDDGVAIAAPQVGAPVRLFIVSGRVFDLKKRGLEALSDEKESKVKGKKPLKSHPKDMVFINPSIIRTSKESAWMVEGCLSLRWLYGNVSRKKRVTIEATDERGKHFTRGAGGLLAQIFQHETDHLDGILFIDKAREIEDIPPEKQRALHPHAA